MLYNEFIENTGCKDTEYNYKVYRQLEVLYMENDNLTKEDIYKTGKMLVDNSKTEKEIEFENKIRAEIRQYENWIEDTERNINFCRELIERHTGYLPYMTEDEKVQTKKDILYWKESIKNYRGYIKGYRRKIDGLKWVLK